MLKNGNKKAENAVFSAFCSEYLEGRRFVWRRRRDSNSRNRFAVYTISSRAPSTRLGDFSGCLLTCKIQLLNDFTCFLQKCQLKISIYDIILQGKQLIGD